MIIKGEILYDFDDLLIQPANVSKINSRKEIIVRDIFGFLPLMTAPMDTVINEKNKDIFKKNGIISVLPRDNSHKFKNESDQSTIVSYGLQEFNEIFLNKKIDLDYNMVLIDVANGHMKQLFESAEKAKKMYGEKIMLFVGNVANPETFERYCDIGVDGVRIGIGGGGGCLTTVQTGIGFPMASLIEKCRIIRDRHKNSPFIIADGGFKSYSDIIKALGLGANSVMLGSIFNKALESAGETFLDQRFEFRLDQYSNEAKEKFNNGNKIFKSFRGMSTKEVQKSWGRNEIKTSEGVSRTNQVEYTLEGWVENFEAYLRSAMSYTGKKELHQFIGGVNFNIITRNALKRFDK
jgi:IMP dehydrogenase/GMP reductase